MLVRFRINMIVLGLITALCPLSAISKDKQAAKTANYQLESDKYKVVFNSDGTHYMDQLVSLKPLNERGRTELGLYSVYYHPNLSRVKVFQAGTVTGKKYTKLDLEKIVDKEVASDATGITGYRQLMVPFDNLKVGSLAKVSYRQTVLRPIVPGVAEMSFAYGVSMPEQNSQAEIVSKTPIQYSVFDDNNQIVVKEKNEDGKYKVIVKTRGVIYKVPSLQKAGQITTGSYPFVLVTSAKSWEQVTNTVAPKYEEAIDSPLPAKFKDVLVEAKKLKAEKAQINLVIQKVLDLVAYSGDWRDLTRMMYPRGHAEVAKTAKGDCKDFATSIAGILRKLGYDANVALVRASAPNDLLFKDVELQKLVPSASYFNHAVAYVKLKSGKELWIDGTRSGANADTIWPTISASPALVLKPGTSGLIKVPQSNAAATVTEIARTVKVLPGDKAEWKGYIKIDGPHVGAFQEVMRSMGEEKTAMAMPRVVINDMALETSRFALMPEHFKSSSQIEANFNILARSPIAEELDKDPILYFPYDPGLLPFFSVDKKSGGKLEASVAKKIRSRYLGYVALDPVDADCHIVSPWLDFTRRVSNEKDKVLIHEDFTVKKASVTKSEASSEQYEYFLYDLRSCLEGSSLQVTKPKAKPKEPIEMDSPILKLPVELASYDRAKDLFINYDSNYYNYTSKKAIRIFDLKLEKDPDNVEAAAYKTFAMLRLGYLFGDRYRKGHAEYALEKYSELLDTNPKDVTTRVFRGELNRRLRRIDEALGDYGVAYRVDPKDYRPMLGLARTYASVGNSRLAESWLMASKPYTKSKGDQIQYWSAYASVYDRIGQSHKWVHGLQKLADLEPGSAWNWHNLSIAYGSIKDHKKAVDMAKKALKISDFGAGRENLGKQMFLKAVGKMPQPYKLEYFTPEVEEDIKSSLKYFPKNEFAYETLVWLGFERLSSTTNPKFIDDIELYLTMAMEYFPDSNSFKMHQKKMNSMKDFVMATAKKKGVKPPGRWVENYANN